MSPKHIERIKQDTKWHKRLWYTSSVAKSCTELNPGYYEALKMSNIVYPLPVFKSVEDDINRTFQKYEDPAKL